MTAQPHSAFFLVDRRKGTSHRVFTDDLLHVQKLRQNAIAAQRGDMGVTLVPRQNRQHCRSQHIALPGSVRARVRQRTIRPKGVEQTSRFHKVDEERQLAKRRERSLVVPFDVNRASKTLEAGRAENPPLLDAPQTLPN